MTTAVDARDQSNLNRLDSRLSFEDVELQRWFEVWLWR